MLSIIVTTLFLTLIINIFLKRIGLPPIIGYIFTGTVITYLFGLQESHNNKELKEIAEFGVVFLMFTIGLEMSIENLKKIRYEVFILGTLQILLTSTVVFLISKYGFGIGGKTSVVIAMAMALSSTAIVLKSLNENGDISKRYGRNVLGILIMQDIAVIPILLIIWFLSTNGGGETGIVVAQMIFGAIILVGLLWVIGKYLLEPFLSAIVKTKSDELFITAILFLAIGASHLAHLFEFSYSLGAFIAGMLIAETKYKHQVETDLIPFRDLLLGIFFVTVGMQINLSVMVENIFIILTLIPTVFLLKFSIIFAITRIRSTQRASLKTAISLVQIGEFSLAVLELSGTSGLINPEYSQILIVTTVISMIMTPMILMNISLFADKLTPHSDADTEVPEDIDERVVILGYGEFGQRVARVMRESGMPYAIVENNIDTYHKGIENGEPIIFGNAGQSNILKLVIKNRDQKVIVAIDNPKKLRQSCEVLQKFVSSDHIIVRVHSDRERELVSDLEIDWVIVENELVSREVLDIIR